MIRLIKANIYRLFHSFFYIAGIVLAFAVTFFFVNVKPIEHIAAWEESRIMIFVSPATILFFSIFTALFVGAEYTNGAIRNKIIAGHTQMEVYLSDYIALMAGVALMLVSWFIGGIAAGAKVDGSLLAYAMVAFFYNCAYIGIAMAISFRIRRNVIATLGCIALFYLSATSILALNYIVSFSEGLMFYIARIIYNINVFGQYFIHLGFMDVNVGPGNIVQMLISVSIAVISALLGTIFVNKRDIV